jgi:hypothetical protein
VLSSKAVTFPWTPYFHDAYAPHPEPESKLAGAPRPSYAPCMTATLRMPHPSCLRTCFTALALVLAACGGSSSTVGDSGTAASGGTSGSGGNSSTDGTVCPGGRYTVVVVGTGPDDGSGQVRDNTTGLLWMQYPYKFSGACQCGNYASVGCTGPGCGTQDQSTSYCTSVGMRLPTEDEARTIAKNPDTCAWPAGWAGTWTSGGNGADGTAEFIFDDGSSTNLWAINVGGTVLCVH